MKALTLDTGSLYSPALYIAVLQYVPQLITRLGAPNLVQVTTSIYRHRLNRLQLLTRGALVGLIHARSLRVESSPTHKEKALTLMSTDVDSVDSSAEMVHETWAQLGEVLVGTTLLARQIGWFALLPLFIIFGIA